MKFISYAQNFEDLILWRALRHIDKGFYVDVGAAWPEEDSVTKFFYDSGWRGINIEPNPEFYSRYANERPEDLNLQLAISDQQGEGIMNFISDTGLSTLNNDVSQDHEGKGYISAQDKVNITTLNCIFDEYITDNRDVHFLKIDVEGLESSVIKGCDWNKHRPWIIVIEATIPMSQEKNHQQWEPLITSCNYDFVYDDGLNRFYLAKEHQDLAIHFSNPPNVFDSFVLFSEYKKDLKIQDRDSEITRLSKEIKSLKKSEKRLQKKVDENHHENWALRHHIALMHQSTSWKVTRPLRGAKVYSIKLYKFIKYFNKKESPKALVRFLMLELNRFPKIKAYLRELVVKTGLSNHIARFFYESAPAPVIHTPNSYSKRARVISSRIRFQKITHKDTDKE